MKNLKKVLGVGPQFVGMSVIITIVCYYLNFTLLRPTIVYGLFRYILIAIGIIFIVIGICLWVQSVLISDITKNVIKDELITNGVYAYVRNPLYSGFMFLFSGLLLILGNLVLTIVPLFLWFLLTVLVKKEEKHLESVFGDEYLIYKNKVNRCIPIKNKED